jgi:hypothetical protein
VLTKLSTVASPHQVISIQKFDDRKKDSLLKKKFHHNNLRHTTKGTCGCVDSPHHTTRLAPCTQVYPTPAVTVIEIFGGTVATADVHLS